jgi:hypothetical protein
MGTISPTILGNVLHNVAYKFYRSYLEIPQELCDQEHNKRILGQRHAEAEGNSLINNQNE